MMKVDRTVKLEGDISLADLRNLVHATQNAPGDTPVDVKESKIHSAIEQDPDVISITYSTEEA